MAWWIDKQVQLKQKFRFVFSIGELLIPTVTSVDKPSIKVDSQEYTMINHVYHYPGIAKWQPVTVKFVDGSGHYLYDPDNNINQPDDGDLDAAKMLFRMLGFSGYDVQSDPFVPQGFTSKLNMINNSFANNAVRIEQINPEGNMVVEGWKLHNPIFTDISWGSLAYSEDSPVEYSLSITYDWAEFYDNVPPSIGQYTQNNMLASVTSARRTLSPEEFADELITPGSFIPSGEDRENQ